MNEEQTLTFEQIIEEAKSDRVYQSDENKLFRIHVDDANEQLEIEYENKEGGQVFSYDEVTGLVNYYNSKSWSHISHNMLPNDKRMSGAIRVIGISVLKSDGNYDDEVTFHDEAWAIKKCEELGWQVRKINKKLNSKITETEGVVNRWKDTANEALKQKLDSKEKEFDVLSEKIKLSLQNQERLVELNSKNTLRDKFSAAASAKRIEAWTMFGISMAFSILLITACAWSIISFRERWTSYRDSMDQITADLRSNETDIGALKVQREEIQSMFNSATISILSLKLSYAIPLGAFAFYFGVRERRAKNLAERYSRIVIIMRTLNAYIVHLPEDVKNELRATVAREIFSLSDLENKTDKDMADVIKLLEILKNIPLPGKLDSK